MSHGRKLDRSKILKLRQMGCSYDAIHERMGCSFSTISEVCHNHTKSEGDTMRLIEKQEREELR